MKMHQLSPLSLLLLSHVLSASSLCSFLCFFVSLPSLSFHCSLSYPQVSILYSLQVVQWGALDCKDAPSPLSSILSFLSFCCVFNTLYVNPSIILSHSLTPNRTWDPLTCTAPLLTTSPNCTSARWGLGISRYGNSSHSRLFLFVFLRSWE